MYIGIYLEDTNGSEDPDKEMKGAGIYIPDLDIFISKRLSSELSIYSVEMVAIIEEVTPDRAVIRSDSALS